MSTVSSKSKSLYNLLILALQRSLNQEEKAQVSRPLLKVWPQQQPQPLPEVIKVTQFPVDTTAIQDEPSNKMWEPRNNSQVSASKNMQLFVYFLHLVWKWNTKFSFTLFFRETKLKMSESVFLTIYKATNYNFG